MGSPGAHFGSKLGSTKGLSLKTRKRIIKAYMIVWSTLLYGCETWTITTRNMTKIAIIRNVGISEDDKNIPERKENK